MMAADRTPNELADALEHDAQRVMWHDEVLQKDDACRWGGVDTLSWAMDMRAAAALLREQAEQLDTLRNERVEAVKAWEQMKAPLGAAEPFMRLDRIMQDWAAAGGGVPEEGA